MQWPTVTAVVVLIWTRANDDSNERDDVDDDDELEKSVGRGERRGESVEVEFEKWPAPEDGESEYMVREADGCRASSLHSLALV